jgi:hypothetical protein
MGDETIPHKPFYTFHATDILETTLQEMIGVSMKRNEVLYLSGGLVIGLVLGVAVIGSSNDLREDLFGTAANPTVDRDNAVEIDAYSYYLVDFTEMQDWLAMVDPDSSDTLGDDLKTVNDLATLVDISEFFTDETQTSVANVLSVVHTTLLQKAFENAQNTGLKTCFGLDRASSQMYMYLEVPDEVSEQVPTNWQKLEAPRANDLLWSTQCYQAE